MITIKQYMQIEKKAWKDYWFYKGLGVVPSPKAKIIRTLRKLKKRIAH